MASELLGICFFFFVSHYTYPHMSCLAAAVVDCSHVGSAKASVTVAQENSTN